MNLVSQPPKIMADKPSPPPQPPSSFLSYVIELDTAWSSRIHTLFEPLVPRAVLKLFEISGDGRLWLPISISLLLSPLSLHSPKLYSFSLCLLLGLILDIAVLGILKHLVRRRRPVYNIQMGRTFAVDHWSFPSGHASRVCFVGSLCFLSIATIGEGLDQLKMRKGEIVDRWIGNSDSGNFVRLFGILALVWALVTSVSRVLLGRHFVLDVVVGASIGAANGLFVYHFLRF